MPDDKLTVKDISREYGIGRDRVYEMFKDPNFPAQKFTRPMFILRSELIKYFSVRHEKIVKE